MNLLILSPPREQKQELNRLSLENNDNAVQQDAFEFKN